jgi:hypothetical protein
MPTTFQQEALPHASLSFEAIHSEVHMAQITDTAETEMPEDLIDDDNIGSELFDLFEVLATEQRKHGSKPQDAPPTTTPPPTAPTYAAPPHPAVNATSPRPAPNATHSTTRPTPQYKYQSSTRRPATHL